MYSNINKTIVRKSDGEKYRVCSFDGVYYIIQGRGVANIIQIDHNKATQDYVF